MLMCVNGRGKYSQRTEGIQPISSHLLLLQPISNPKEGCEPRPPLSISACGAVVGGTFTVMESERASCCLRVWRHGVCLLLLQMAGTLSSPSPGRSGAGRAEEGTVQYGGGCPGQCIPLQNCPRLLQLLTTKNSQDIQLLQEATCSFRGNEPQVCCSAGNADGEMSLLPSDCGRTPLLSKIVGGRTASLGAFPWMAVLGFLGEGSSEVEFLCAGSIINPKYVLTAAHCLHPSTIGSRRLEVVRLGEWDLSTDPDCLALASGVKLCAPSAQNVSPEEVTVHPDYGTRMQFSDDIALVRLSRPLDLSGPWIGAVCLPPQGLDVGEAAGGRNVLVAGWSLMLEGGNNETRLLEDYLSLDENGRCSSTYGVKLVAGQMCLGVRPSLEPCAGDSGSPVVFSGPRGPPFMQVGVVSFGPARCDGGDFPGVYTSVSYYRDWIEKNLKP